MNEPPDMAPDFGTYRSTSNRSRGDQMMVAVGFSPRIAPVRRPRRVATLEKLAPRFMRRYATRPFPASHRGLKPTATFASSLRDAPFGESRRDSVCRPRVGAPASRLVWFGSSSNY